MAKEPIINTVGTRQPIIKTSPSTGAGATVGTRQPTPKAPTPPIKKG